MLGPVMKWCNIGQVCREGQGGRDGACFQAAACRLSGRGPRVQQQVGPAIAARPSQAPSPPRLAPAIADQVSKGRQKLRHAVLKRLQALTISAASRLQNDADGVFHGTSGHDRGGGQARAGCQGSALKLSPGAPLLPWTISVTGHRTPAVRPAAAARGASLIAGVPVQVQTGTKSWRKRWILEGCGNRRPCLTRSRRRWPAKRAPGTGLVRQAGSRRGWEDMRCRQRARTRGVLLLLGLARGQGSRKRLCLPGAPCRWHRAQQLRAAPPSELGSSIR